MKSISLYKVLTFFVIYSYKKDLYPCECLGLMSTVLFNTRYFNRSCITALLVSKVASLGIISIKFGLVLSIVTLASVFKDSSFSGSVA